MEISFVERNVQYENILIHISNTIPWEAHYFDCHKRIPVEMLRYFHAQQCEYYLSLQFIVCVIVRARAYSSVYIHRCYLLFFQNCHTVTALFIQNCHTVTALFIQNCHTVTALFINDLVLTSSVTKCSAIDIDIHAN